MFESKSSEIKSTAIVKCKAATAPSNYCTLDESTNLNLQPNNWLKGKFAVKEPWVPGQTGGNRENSSLVMAHNSIDLVGRVDVVSDAENIKRLLRLPYSTESISMMIHRIGKTIFIDRFDANKHLCRQQDIHWEWLRRFVHDHVFQTGSEKLKDRFALALPANTREAVEEKIMMSKFLYHSINDSIPNEEVSAEVIGSPKKKRSQALSDPLMVEQSEVPKSTFERQVLWTFEDIRMLVGTDIPIFGSGKYPCVTLRLKDMKKEINVLTGLDMWLDNLMCNVPQVVMCYHLDGIVQKYEKISTEELPDLAESPFSPSLVRDVAQNILSFLKSNATKEGHTYWLLKDNDEVVKLYDLTSICPEYMTETDMNPFTLPVALLMYKVAKGLAEHSRKKPRKSAKTIYKLLNDCLELLNKEKFPQIVGSVHYLLADLYLNCILNGELLRAKSETETTSDTDSDSLDDCSDFTSHKKPCGKECGPSECTMSLASLMSPSTSKMQSGESHGQESSSGCCFLPNCSSISDACSQVLEHVYEGLQCAEINDKRVPGETVASAEEEEVVRANPFKPIPLHYERLNKLNESLLPLTVTKPQMTLWQCELVTLLFIKAMNAYFVLAESCEQVGNHGKSLKFIKSSLLCYESCVKLVEDQHSQSETLSNCKKRSMESLTKVLMLCGDLHLHLAHDSAENMGRHKRDLHCVLYRDSVIASKAKRLLGCSQDDASIKLDYDHLTGLSGSIEENLSIALKTYETAYAHWSRVMQSHKSGTVDEQVDVTNALIISKSIGNAKNELGVYYMKLGSTVYARELLVDKDTTQSESPEPSEKVRGCWASSFKSFTEGIEIFEKIFDKTNVALLNSNTAQLMRTCALCYSNIGKELREEEKHYLRQSLEFYQKALESVKARTDAPIWSTILWDLSSTYFALATSLQERPPLSVDSVEKIEKEIGDCMHKALQFLDTLISSNKDCEKNKLYNQRVAVIHHKLASMYHKIHRATELNERKSKQMKTLAERHYNKALGIYKDNLTDNALAVLRVHMELIGLFEHSAENVSSFSGKLKLFVAALNEALACHPAFMELAVIAPKIVAGKKLVSSKDSSRCSTPRPSAHNESQKTVDLSSLSVEKKTDELLNRSSDDKLPESDWSNFFTELEESSLVFFTRLQFLMKHVLQLAKTSKKHAADEVLMEQLKTAYASILLQLPQDVLDIAPFIVMILDKLKRQDFIHKL